MCAGRKLERICILFYWVLVYSRKNLTSVLLSFKLPFSCANSLQTMRRVTDGKQQILSEGKRHLDVFLLSLKDPLVRF